LRTLLLAVLFLAETANASCRPFHYQLSHSSTLKVVAKEIQEISGCNIVVDPILEELEIAAPLAISGIGDLTEALGIKAISSRNLFVLLPPDKSLTLTGKGRLVSVKLNNARVPAINRILQELGAEQQLSTDKLIGEAHLNDIALEDLIPVLKLKLER
jgi:hypothetical protein